MPSTEETQYPGAGTLYVYSASPHRGISPSRSNKRRQSPSMGAIVPKRWEDIVKTKEEPKVVSTPDSLLQNGIAGFTYLPYSSEGVLGRGKFSTVYKVIGSDGNFHALKHTALYPHHPFISARLLREPTLLAELPRHPCLIGVEGWVRTEGHFYLVEQYATNHVPLPTHPLPVTPSRAAYILDQLVSGVRDTLHEKGRVCHRDLKGDNILVDVDSGDIIILDLGLATKFSMSQPKLSTCCGSPAFHSPEIVMALSRPPGEITYYGPELDIWCIALTLLSLLLHVRFPLGPKHTSPYIMRERAMDRLQELDELYPRHNPCRPRPLSISARMKGYAGANTQDTDVDFEKHEWRRVRKAMDDFLDIDGVRRMEKFRAYEIGDKTRKKVESYEAKEVEKKFKLINFIPTEVKYTLPIFLEGEEKIKKKTGVISLSNPLGESERRVKSYIKYLLRSAGILYHVLPQQQISNSAFMPTPQPPVSSSSQPFILQVVVPLLNQPSSTASPTSPPSPSTLTGWFPSIFSFRQGLSTQSGASPAGRSVSVPPIKKSHSPSPILLGDKPGSNRRYKLLRCYIKVEFENIQRAPLSDRDKRSRASSETFTSLRGGLDLTTLHQVSVSSTNSISTSATSAQSNSTVHTLRPAHPQRSASACHHPQGRPHPRRAASLMPASKDALATHRTNAAVAVMNMAAPPSPLSRHVSLGSSSSDSETPASRILNRPPSRASSISRKTSGARPSLLLSHAHSSFTLPNQYPARLSSLESKIHIHLSDQRAYFALVKALDIKHDGGLEMHHGVGDPALSPITMRRPSLVPRVAEGVEIPNSGLEEELELEPDRGRARSKDDGSSLLSGYRNGNVPEPLSPISTITKLSLATTVIDALAPVDIRLEGNVNSGHRPKDHFEKRAPRDTSRGKGLLNVLFGKSGDIRTSRSSSVPPLAFGEVMTPPL
ncbi:serine/threonine protein kinase [Cryptococcus neoformans Bt15]|nr:serine/threonine protein kinase [Cryptococcus neoformans var. grubii Bt15]